MLTREEFIKLCAANPEMKLERSAKGELIVMSPTGGETGSFNSDLNGELYIYGITHANKVKPLIHRRVLVYRRVAIAHLMRHGFR